MRHVRLMEKDQDGTLGKALDTTLSALGKRNVNDQSERVGEHYYFYALTDGQPLAFDATWSQLFLAPLHLAEQNKDVVPHLYLCTRDAYTVDALAAIDITDLFSL